MEEITSSIHYLEEQERKPSSSQCSECIIRHELQNLRQIEQRLTGIQRLL